MNILSIGYGRNLFDQNDPERKRLAVCAQKAGALHMVIFTRAKDGLLLSSSSNLHVYPTNSASRIHMLFDAFKIGRQILKEGKGSSWVITAQDPFEAGIVGLLLSKAMRVACNVQEHGDFFSTAHWRKSTLLNNVRHVLGRYVLSKADTVRVVSARIAATMQEMGIKAERILYLPVRTDSINTAAPKDLHALYPQYGTIILSLGRLVPQKNLTLLIRSFARVLKQEPSALLLIIGSGPEESGLKDLSAALDLDANIVFIPWSTDPYAYISGADVFALSSHWEGWGRVLIEAMSAGTPVVTTDVGCANEILIDGKHGFVVPVGDEDAFSNRLLSLMQDVSLQERFGAAAKQDVENIHMTLDAYAEKWSQVWNDTYAKAGKTSMLDK